MSDDFATYREGLDAPANNALAVTPADGAALAKLPRALYIGGAGDVVVTMADDTGADAVVAFAGAQSGQIIPIRAKTVEDAGTTATGIVALW